MHAGQKCLVVWVNDCRALIQPMDKITRTVVPKTGRNAGKPRVFEQWQKAYSISPDSELEILPLRAAITKQTNV